MQALIGRTSPRVLSLASLPPSLSPLSSLPSSSFPLSSLPHSSRFLSLSLARWYSTGISNYKVYLKKFREAKTSAANYELKQEVLEEENKFRDAFAKGTLTPESLQERNEAIIPVFENAEDFKLREFNGDIPKVFVPKARPPPGTPVIVANMEEFSKNFTLFTESQFRGFNWDNVLVAGGSVLAALTPVPEKYKTTNLQRMYYHDTEYKSSDVDLFIYGLTEEQANEKIKEIYKYITENLHVEAIAFRSQHAISIVSQYPFRHIQIVLRLYQSPAEILMGFDVDGCAMGYDGKNVLTLPRCHQALVTSTNTIDMSRRSPTYEIRLAKYAKRGFSVEVPNLDRSKVDPMIFEKNFEDINGLARLLLLERLTTPTARTQYKNQKHLKSIRPLYEKRGAFWDDLNNRIYDDYTRDREADSSAMASDYSLVFLPWGPRWTARKVKKIMFKKDLVLNSRWYDPKKQVHTHPAFFGTIHEVMQDCCGSCPPAPPNPIDPKTGLDDPFVRGPLTWMTVNPGGQSIGSFHPITEGDWAAGTYIDPKSEELCKAVNSGDLKLVERLLSEGADVNAFDVLRCTPLINAALCNHSNGVEMVKLLLKNGAWISPTTSSGRTALHMAAQYGHLEILKVLLEHGKVIKAREDTIAATTPDLNAIEKTSSAKDSKKAQAQKEEEEEEEEEEEDEEGDVAEGEGKIEENTRKEEKPKVDKFEIDLEDNECHMTALQYAVFFWVGRVRKRITKTQGRNASNDIEKRRERLARAL